MKTLLFVVVLLAVCVVAMGFYLDWFQISMVDSGDTAEIKLLVNKEKIKQDRETVKDKIGEGGEKTKEKAAGQSETTKE